MEMYILIASWLTIIIAFAVAAIMKIRNSSGSLFVVAAGVFISGVLLFIPAFLSSEVQALIPAIFAAVRRAMQMFVLNRSSDGPALNIDITFKVFYDSTLGVLQIIAPIISATAILSLVGDTLSALRCYTPTKKDKYIFSEINKKSLELALSIKKNKPDSVIVFSNLNAPNDESVKLIEKIKAKKFFLIKKSVDAIYGKLAKCKAQYHYFNLTENATTNIDTSIKLIDKYADHKKVFIYIFTNDIEDEMLFDEIIGSKQNIKIINETQTIVYELLAKNPVYSCIKNEKKNPSVLLLGFGHIGIQLLQSMLWCTRSSSYHTSFMAMDRNIEERVGVFKRHCPGIDMKQYDINYLHENIDFNTFRLVDYLTQNGAAYNYIVISTNDDDLNIKMTLDLVSLYRRMQKSPVFNVLIRDELKYEVFKNHIYKDEKINFFGNYKDFFQSDVILEHSLDRMAMVINQVYCDFNKPEEEQKQFDRKIALYDWNLLTSVQRRSNKALAVYLQYRLWEQGCKYVEKDATGKQLNYLKDVLKDDLLKYSMVEHERWNAFMLTEGWYTLGFEEAIARGKHVLTIEKQHACITNWDSLAVLGKSFNKKFIEFDMNFVLKTEEILNGYAKDFGYNYKIVSLDTGGVEAP